MQNNQLGSWNIRDVEIPGRILLAPMAGVTDLAFRLLCKEQGASLVVMEMISAKAITYGNEKTLALMKTDPKEKPVSLQLFGKEPDVMAKALQQIEDQPFDIVDINMGCPVPKIVNNGEGSALMKDPFLIEQIVSACVKATSRPVTVKIRSGFDRDHINAVECAKAAEAGGASMVTVHARTRTQMYEGKADWSIIRDVVQAVGIPVVGNGDVTSGETAEQLFDETGCTAVMIGRASRGNPWIFHEVEHYLLTKEKLPRPTREEITAMILREADLVQEFKGETIGVKEMRGQASWYLQGFPGASLLRKKISSIQSFDELKEILYSFL